MKISRDKLQEYFKTPLPRTAEIADAFTFHCFEIEEVDGDTLDVKVLTNRAEDCSTEAGIAAELSSILNLPLTHELNTGFSEHVVEVSLDRMNAILGFNFSAEEVEDVFRRLRFSVEKSASAYRVAAPLPRVDIQIPEDVAEEVGRILGYDRIPVTELPPASTEADQARYRGIEKMKDMLIEQGYTEVSTQSFTKKGDVYLAKPLDKTKPALRTSLEENLRDALKRAKQYAPLVFPPKISVKLFEVGTVFPKKGEYLELRMTERVAAWGDAAGVSDNLSIAKLEDYGKDYEPKRYALGKYKPFSAYPYVIRDIAVWVPSGIKETLIEANIRERAGELLVRLDHFDHFEKEGKTSYAFRLVFQSMERTLTDTEVAMSMTNVTTALTEKGYEVR